MVIRVLHAYKTYKPDSTGGVAEVIANLAHDGDRGFTDDILVARTRGFSRDSIEDGVPVHAVASLGTLSSMPLAPGYPIALGEAAKRADLLVYHFPFPLVDVGLLTTVPPHLPLIIHWHADIVRAKTITRMIEPLVRNSLRRCERVIVSDPAIISNSPFLADFKNKCVVVPYGTDVDYWALTDDRQKGEVEKIRLRFPRLVLAVGRLVPYKGFSVLLRALREINANLMIVGEGPLQSALLKEAKELDVIERLTLVGNCERDHIKVLMHASRALAFPSISSAESFGLVQLEAMAAGLPIVNTFLPTAVPNISRHNIEALTVPPDDYLSLASALTALLSDKELAERLGQAGQARVRDFYQLSAFTKEIRNQYKEVVN